MGEDKNYARRVENRSREGISVFLTIYLPFSDRVFSGRMQSFYSPLQEHIQRMCYFWS